MSNTAYIAGQIRQLATAEHHYTLQLASDAGGKTNFINLTPSEFAQITTLLLLGPERNLYHQLNRLLAEARACIEEPIAIQYAENVFIEVRPEADGNQLSVARRGHGFTHIDYAHDKLSIEVYDESSDEVHTLTVTNDGLTLEHADGHPQQQSD